MLGNELSSWTQYPSQYKFMSIEFDLNMDVQYTDRASYDFLNWMGDVGGSLEILLLACNMIAYSFSIIRIKAIITNRLFRLSAANQQSILRQVDLSEKQLNDYNLKKTATGEILIDVPKNMTPIYIKHLCCSYLCRRKSQFAKYEEIIQHGYLTFDKNLDILFLMRRLKMYSISLYRLLPPQ